jgi:hypothetical protein
MADPFRARVYESPTMYAMLNEMRRWLHEGLVTTPDLARLAVLAAQIYAEHNCAPVVIRIEEGGDYPELEDRDR